jgi:hypothetical protein
MENSERNKINNDNNNNDNDNENKGDSDDKFNQKMINIFKKGYVWRPIPTITHTVLCLLSTGIIFITLGIIILILSSKITTIIIRYDNIEKCDLALKNKENNICEIKLTIDKKLEQPIFVYYQIENFYQNHRRYLKSKSLKQLKGNKCEKKDVKDDCDPIITNRDLGRIFSVDGSLLNENEIAHPCGLIARSYFNDSFELYYNNDNNNNNDDNNDNNNNDNNENNNDNNNHNNNDNNNHNNNDINQSGENLKKNYITIYSEGIASKSDKKRYKNLKDENWKKIQWLNVEDERFLVWMRPAGLNNFRKLWGKINVTLNEGEYILSIKNNFPVSYFNGKKSFVLSTVNVLGGKNNLLGWSYVVVGAISLISSFLFWFEYYRFMKLNQEAIENIKKEENKID